MAKIEKNTILGRALVKVRSKIEKTPFLVGLWLEKGQIEKNALFGMAFVRIRL